MDVVVIAVDIVAAVTTIIIVIVAIPITFVACLSLYSLLLQHYHRLTLFDIV